jgi:hypothetical protein
MVKHQKSILIVYEFKTANGKIKNRCNLRSIESGLGEAYFTKLDFPNSVNFPFGRPSCLLPRFHSKRVALSLEIEILFSINVFNFGKSFFTENHSKAKSLVSRIQVSNRALKLLATSAYFGS